MRLGYWTEGTDEEGITPWPSCQTGERPTSREAGMPKRKKQPRELKKPRHQRVAERVARNRDKAAMAEWRKEARLAWHRGEKAPPMPTPTDVEDVKRVSVFLKAFMRQAPKL